MELHVLAIRNVQSAEAMAIGCSEVVKMIPLQVLAGILRHVDWAIVKCLVIAGPAFTKDQFKSFMELQAVQKDLR